MNTQSRFQEFIKRGEERLDKADKALASLRHQMNELQGAKKRRPEDIRLCEARIKLLCVERDCAQRFVAEMKLREQALRLSAPDPRELNPLVYRLVGLIHQRFKNGILPSPDPELETCLEHIKEAIGAENYGSRIKRASRTGSDVDALKLIDDLLKRL